MEEILKNIVDYLAYLNDRLGLSTSVHFTEKCVSRLPEKYFSRLLPYNVHKNPYCVFVKKERGAACVLAQRQIQSVDRRDGFCRVCHAGVCEYVQLFRTGDQVLGHVSVSGFRCPETHVPPEDRSRWEENLSDQPLPETLCRTVIPPLCRMLELFFMFPMDMESRDEYNLILQYINERHGQVSLEELSSHFGRSRSYVSHLFNQRCGMTLRAYCNDLKLSYAQRLLTTTEVSVTEAALDAGFNDVAYFIGLFRDRFGQTPLQYRKQMIRSNA